MPKAGKEGRFDVSIYLIKAAQSPIAESELLSSTDFPQPLKNDIPGGKFLALPMEAKPPKWASKVEALLTDGDTLELLAQSAGGILWIPRGKKTFVFTFGYAHAKLKDEWLEPEFGKKTALSVIPQGQVVEVRAEQVFARWHIASERAPRASTVRNFGFEPDRDLVSAVEGVPSPKYFPVFGNKLRGGTALKFGVHFSKLLETLDVVAERFDSGDYKKSWPQVDNLVVVRDESLFITLDVELDKILTGKNPQDRISLAAPAMRSGDKPYPQHYALGRMRKEPTTAPYLSFGSWDTYLRRVNKPLGVNSSLETTVHLLDEDKEQIECCTMYQCFGAEVSVNGKPFVLAAGVWYEAKHRFVHETNQLIANLALPPHTLPGWNQKDDEGKYNEDAPKSDASLWWLDKKLVNFGGGRSKFEFCDLMHLPTKTLYFVKHPSGSASVSHLCEQLRRTVANFFSTDDEFRTKLAKRIIKYDESKDTTWLNSRPHRHEWNLCLVSMGKDANSLPFFAKCGVARLVRELEQGGFNISFQTV